MTLPATVHELLDAPPAGTRWFRLPEVGMTWWASVTKATAGPTITFLAPTCGSVEGWSCSGSVRTGDGRIVAIENLAVEWGSPRCRSGKHAWLGQEDADRCCNSEYRRELRVVNGFARHVWVRVVDGHEERQTLWRDLLS